MTKFLQNDKYYKKQKGELSMIEQDTIKLLRECDAGIKMGTKSIDDVMDFVKSKELRNDLVREIHIP